MEIFQDAVIDELKFRIKLQEKHNEVSARRMEEKLLLWLGTETISQSGDDQDLLLSLLERISVLLDIPYCACLQQSGNELRVQAEYCQSQVDHDLMTESSISICKHFHGEIKDTPILKSKAQLESLGIELEHKNIPEFIGIFPFASIVIPFGMFVFIETTTDRSTLGKLNLVIHQLLKLAVAKLEKFKLIEELKDLNRIYETKLRERTFEIDSNYQKLKKEIKDRKKKETPTKTKKTEKPVTYSTTEVLKDISLEIRTPMNGIMGFTEILRDNNIPKQEKSNYIDIIKSCANSLLKIVDDAINYSFMTSDQLVLKAVEFELTPFLTNLYDKFKKDELYKQREKVDLRLNININGSTKLNCDKDRLQQVLTNLIGNAIKFTSEGYIEFGCYVARKTKEIKIPANEGDLVFFVQDTGVGIEPDAENKIFDPFFKIEHEISKLYGGMGLGLSLAKDLVEMMGGSIWYDSEPEKGSKFFFSLPGAMLISAPETPTGRKKREKDYNWENKNVLVVEDDEMSYLYLKEVLKNTKANIVVAKNGKEAIKKARDNPDIDIVLMDIKLPGMNGYEATGIIKSIMNVPVIAQTAYAMVDDYKKSLDVGCDDYISKPINRKNLLKSMADLMEQYEAAESP